MLAINGLELREGGEVFYLLSESEERRLDAGELRRVLHTLVDRAGVPRGFAPYMVDIDLSIEG